LPAAETERPAAPRRKRRPHRRVLRLILALLVVALVVAGLVVRSRLDGWLRSELETRLAAALGVPVVVEALEVSLVGRSVDLRGLRVGDGGGSDSTLQATIESAALRFSWTGLWGLKARRVELAELRLDTPRLDLDRAFVDARPDRAEDAEPFDIRIGRLEIADGELKYRDRTLEVDVGAEDVQLAATWSEAGDALVGRMAFRSTVLDAPLAKPLPLEVDTRFRWSGTRIEWPAAEIKGPGIAAQADPYVDWGEGTVFAGPLRIDADLDVLAEWLEPGFPTVGGTVRWPADLYVGGGEVRLSGPALGENVRFSQLRADRVETRVDYLSGRLGLSELIGAAYGGQIQGGVEVELGSPDRFRVEISGSELWAHELFEMVDAPIPAAARTALDLRLEGDPGDPATWNGEGRATLLASPGRDGLVPFGGSGTFRLDDGFLRVDAPAVEAGSARFTLGLEMGLAPGDPRRLLSLEGETLSAADTRWATVRVLEPFDVELPALALEPLAGRGEISALVLFGDETVFELDLALRDGAYSNEAFDSAELRLIASPDRVRIEKLSAQRGEQQIEGSLSVLSDNVTLEALDVTARDVATQGLLERLDLGDLEAGAGSGTLKLERGPNGLSGEGHLQLRDVRWLGERIDEIHSTVGAEGETLRLTGVRANGPAVTVAGDVDIDLSAGSAEVRIEEGRIRLEELARIQEVGLPGTGSVDFDGTLRFGTEEPLTGLLHVQAVDAALLRKELGGGAGTITLLDDHAELRLATLEGPPWKADVRLGLAEPFPIDATFELADSSFDLPYEAAEAWARLTGRASLEGDLSDPESLAGLVDLDRAEFNIGGHTLRAAGGFDLRLDNGVVVVDAIRIVGEATEVEGSLTWRIEDGTIGGRLEGQLDLGVAAAAFDELRAQGRAVLGLDLGGTLESPSLRGTARVDRGRVRLLGFPDTLEQLRLDAVFDGQRVEIRSLEAFLGGGALRAEGEASLVGLSPGPFRLTFEGSNLRLHYPEGFRGIYEGTAVLEGDANGALLSGDMRMIRGLYDEEFDLYGMLGIGVRGFEPAAESRLPESVRLDVNLDATNNVWVRNSTARIESGLDLHFGGDLARTEVTGRIVLLEGGRIRFRDVDYDITSGTLDLLEPERIDPYFNIRAETEVDPYEVFLHIEGTAERISYQLTSSPSLTQQDIIALLATGRTLDDPGASAGSFTGDVATNYFAGALTAPFERQLQQALKVDRIEIAPIVVGESADTTARITVGKEVAEDVMIVASSDLGSTERELYQLEWRASRKFRVAAGRDTNGGIGGEFRYLDRFWIERPESVKEAARAPERKSAAPAGGRRVESLAIEGAAEGKLEELLRRVPFEVGDPFQRGELFEGAEAIRRYYVDQGRIETFVSGHEAPSADDPDRVRVTYRVEPGSRVDVSFTGLSQKLEKRVRQRLRGAWVESIFSEDLAYESAELIREYLRERGYYTADVGIEETVEEGVERLRFDVDPGKLVRIERVVIEGADAVGAARVRQQILSGRGVGRPVLLPELLEEDRQAVRALYLDEGHLRAKVEEPRIRLSADGDRAAVVLEIDEGPQFTVARIEVDTPGPFAEEELTEWSGLAVGKPISPAALLSGESAMRAAMDARGHPDARVRGRVELADATALVRFDAQPGDFKRVGAIEISGNDLTRTRIVERELELEPGEPISRGRLFETQHNLYQLGIFRNVRLRYEPLQGDDPALQTLHVEVEEDKPLVLRLGAGYDSEAEEKLSFSLAHQNLGGWNRTLAFQGRLSEIEKRGQVSLEEPRLGGHRLKAVANVRFESQEEVSFTEETLATGLRLEKPLGRHKSGFVRYTFQRVDITEVDDPLALIEEKTDNVRLGDVGLAFAYDTRDDPFATTRGGYNSVEVRVFSEPLLSEESFTKGFFRSSHSHTFRNGQSYQSVFRIGASEPFGDTTRVPISERFFAGGDSTLRGFGRDEVGPEIDGSPIGGEAMLLINQEWRFPLYKQLGGVVFYDAGNVYLTVDDFDPADLRHVLGAGLRIWTPIGPIRLEYGHKLDKEDDEKSGELFLAVGLIF
jgi:outer membrane protein insertion porin family